MQVLLDGFRVLNNQKGRKVMVYGRTEDGLTNFEAEIDNLYASKRLNTYQADELVRLLASKGIKSTKEKSGNKYVVHVRGERGLKSKLNRIAPKKFSNASTDESLRLRFPVYSRVDFSGEGPEVLSYSSLEDIDGDLACFDIEMEKKGAKDYKWIPMSTVVKERNGKKMTYFGVVEDAYPGEIENVEIIKVKEQDDISKRVASLIYDVPFASAHFISYDVSRLRDHPKKKKSERLFTPSMDDTQPRIKTVKGESFLKIVRMPGKSWFDTCSFSRNRLPLPADKLVHVYTYFFPDDPFEKSLDYEEFEGLMVKRDKESLREAALYNIEDTERLFRLAKKVKKIALPIARALKTDLTSVCSVSQSNVARGRWNYEYFKSLKTYRPNKEFVMKDFDYKEEKMKLFERLMKKEENPFKKIKNNKGIYENVPAVYPIFTLSSLPHVKDKEIEELYRMMQTSDPIEAVIYAEALDSLCEEPLFDLLCWKYPLEYHPDLKGRKREMIKDYEIVDAVERTRRNYIGTYKEDPETTFRNLAENIRGSISLLRTMKIGLLNYSNRFLFLEADESVLDDIDYSLFIPYETPTKFLSAGKGKLVAKIGKSLITSEADIEGKHGLKCEFEKEILLNYTDLVFDGKEREAQEYIAEVSRKLASGKVPIEKLAKKVKRNKKVYSEKAHKTERVRAIEYLGLKYKEEARFLYSVDTEFERIENMDENYIDIEKYQDKIFGPESKRGRQFSKGSVGKYVAAVEIKKHKKGSRKKLATVVDGKNSSLFDF